jgi:hypothetical protein
VGLARAARAGLPLLPRVPAVLRGGEAVPQRIPGNECAGIAIADRLISARPPVETDIWVVPDLNPDGATAGTAATLTVSTLTATFLAPAETLRHLRLRPAPAVRAGDEDRPVEHVRPAVSIRFHQHLDLVDDSTGNRSLEPRFARAAGLHLAPLAHEPGSALAWETHGLPRASAFVVELSARTLAPAAVDRLAQATRLSARE